MFVLLAMIQKDIFELIERMAAIIRSEERKKCVGVGLQLIHLQVLNYLSSCNKYSDTPAALTAYLGSTKGTISQTLLLLEKKGYIKKVTDSKDKRKVHIKVQDSGHSVIKKARPTELYNQAASIIGKKDESQLNDVFIQVLTALQKANKSASFGICKTCKHFKHSNTGYMCGLTKEALSVKDSEKICREHTVI